MINKTIENCIKCNACTKHCDFLTKYGINLLDFATKPHLAYSCFLCNRCKHVCPKDLSGQEIALIHMQNASNKSKLPIILKENYIFKNIPKNYSETILFLGCNYPCYYPKTCNKLIKICSEKGIEYSIDCCKKPIIDSGLKSNIDAMNDNFKSHGVKQIICACPNCYHTFKKNFKNIEIISVYRFLKNENIGSKILEIPNVFFPCSDRYKREIFEDIKYFLNNSYVDKFKDVNCCGLGGNARKKEKDLLYSISNKLHSYNADNIYTYCSSCSGIFKFYKLKNIKNFLSEILNVHESVSEKYLKNAIKSKFKNRIKVKKETNMNKELILKYLTDGYNCSQTVFMYFADRYNISVETASAIAKGFESGMFKGETCGAVSGAYMILGLHFPKLSRNEFNEKINKFNELFKAKMSSTCCEKLLGININIGNNLEKAINDGTLKSICPNAVISSIEILENIINNN